MKIFFTFILTTILLYSCKQDSKPKESGEIEYVSDKPNTFIAGNITHAKNNIVVLKQGAFSDTASIDNHGNFAFGLNLKSVEYFHLQDGKNNIKIFLEPEYNLHLNYNSSKPLGSMVFSGQGSEANTYLKNKYLLMLDNGLSPASLYQMHPERYRYLIDSLFVINKLFFNEFVGKTELPDNFKQTELASLKYDRATKLIEYLYSSTYAHEVQEKQYLEFLEKLSVNTPELLSIYEYKSFLRAYITYFSNKKINAKNLASHEITLSKIQTVNLLIENQEIKDYLLFTFLKDQVKYYGYKDSEILFEVFKLNCKNEDFKLQLLAPYNAFINLSEKQQAPAFNISRSNGETLTISHFEDSYIYIDVWASWCLPCGKETPFFEKLKQKYKDKQIEFVSLSIDSKKEDWMEYLESKKLDHNQFLVLDTELFLDAYMIKTIPHFLIIDDKGNLIDNNASRPSEERTEWLDKLPNKHSVGSRLR